LRVTGTPYAAQCYLAAAGAVMTLGQAGALAVVYFLTARLGLALQAQPSDVTVFWPASGVVVAARGPANGFDLPHRTTRRLAGPDDTARACEILRGPPFSYGSSEVSPVSGMLRFDASPKSNSKSSLAGGISGADPVFSEQRGLQLPAAGRAEAPPKQGLQNVKGPTIWAAASRSCGGTTFFPTRSGAGDLRKNRPPGQNITEA
jgi:hypothetical protein